MNAQQLLALPLAERVLVGYELFAGKDVESMSQVLAPDVSVTVHGIRGGCVSTSGATEFFQLMGELSVQRSTTATPVEVAEGPEHAFVLVDVDAGQHAFQELHLFRHDEGGRVCELIIVPIDATLTQALWP